MEKITKQYFCDRCKKEIVQPFCDPTVTIQRLHYTFHDGLAHRANCKDDVEFCSDCASEFLKWMKFIR
jgi:hypothetical protein